MYLSLQCVGENTNLVVVGVVHHRVHWVVEGVGVGHQGEVVVVVPVHLMMMKMVVVVVVAAAGELQRGHQQHVLSL